MPEMKERKMMKKNAPPGLARRKFLTALGAVGVMPLLSTYAKASGPRVIVVGAGFGGATCAKYIKMIDPGIDVTLIERSNSYTTCPFSNLVLGGLRSFDSIVHSYQALMSHWGINLIHDTATAVDGQARTVTLASGATLPYDRLVLSPGIELLWNAIPGYDEAASEIMPHGWKAGPQTLLLQKQLAAIENGALIVIAAPDNPYRCPPAPYERASMMAHYLKTKGKFGIKIMILDAKDKFTKQDLFLQAWPRFYPGIIEWVSGSQGGEVTAVDPKTMTVTAKAGTFKAALANIVPPQSAGQIAIQAGVAKIDGWCEIDPWAMESKNVPGIHVIGDACMPGAMPKSGFAANSQAKNCAAAVAALVRDRKPTEPVYMNTCYSTIAPNYAVSVVEVFRAAANGVIAEVMGAGGQSPMNVPDSFRSAEYDYAQGWYESTMQEMFG